MEEFNDNLNNTQEGKNLEINGSQGTSSEQVLDGGAVNQDTADSNAEEVAEEVNETFGDEVAPASEFSEPQSRTPYGQENIYNKINYTDKGPISNYTPFSRGLKVFCAALAAVILLVGSISCGYFLGRSSNKSNFYRNDVKLDLSKKPSKGDGMTAAEIYEALNPSIVGIRVYNSTTGNDATGVIYSEEGYVITNDHIYASVGAPKFRIYTYDGKEYDAEYVAGDTVSDLAVLKIKNGSGFKVPVFGDSNELVCGEDTFAVGRPNDASGGTSITSGIISLTSRRVKSKTNYSSRLIQTDSAINPGSSGGALVNMYGQVIGITSAKLLGEEYDRVGFAIPTVTVKRVVDQLISNGKVTDRAKLGITYNEINSVTKQLENRASTGLLVVSVSSDSDLYGRVNKDDIITHINGIEITEDDTVLDVIESLKAGDTIKITVLSTSGDQTEINAKLGANIGESSFKIDESEVEAEQGEQEKTPDNPGGGTFDFPFGD